MSQPDQSLAVIDATDAEVLAPEGAPLALTIQQTEQLDKCQFHLHRLGRRIAVRETDLIYLYVEAGFYLLKAQEVHRLSHGGTNGEGGQFIATGGQQDGGFRTWLERPEVNMPKTSAYRYMQGARNMGLTAESHITSLQAIKEEHRLQGRTLGDICRKPVNKEDQQAEVHAVTDEEAAAERLADLREAWRKIGEFLTEQGINEKSWADLPPDDIEALEGVLHAAHREVKAARKPKTLPAPAKKPAAVVAPAPAPLPEPEPVVAKVLPKARKGRGKQKSATEEADALRGVIEGLAAGPAEEADPAYTQEDADRGLWWYGYRNPYGRIVVHTWKGDMGEVLEVRRDPRLVTVGPFHCHFGQEQAEKRVAAGVEGQRSQAEIVAAQRASL